jgi:hypothetical protein
MKSVEERLSQTSGVEDAGFDEAGR